MPSPSSLFLSHGAPTLLIEPSPARDFLASYGGELGRPRAILVVSAHWDTRAPRVTAAPRPDTVHDFFGFPQQLYRLRYPVAGDPQLAALVAQRLAAAGLGGEIDQGRGLDHGAWVPLSLFYPDAEIPTIQLSLQTALGPAHHLALGQALGSLRQDGVLIIGSGGLTHNLRDYFGNPVDAPPLPYVRAFAEWMGSAIEEGRTADLLDYRSHAPEARRAHPTEEHLLPLFVALGAAEGRGRRVHASTTYGVLAMDVFAFP